MPTVREDNEPKDLLAAEVGSLLRKQKLKLATAESCTAGLIAHRIARISGSSDYLLGGIIAYANAIKVRLLAVQATDIEVQGAVSETVARQMALGACTATDADVAVAISGIMGPTGGSKEKPVGLAYISVATPEQCNVKQIQNSGTREELQWVSSDAALVFLRDILTTRGDENGEKTGKRIS